jgi:hypothetical protein
MEEKKKAFDLADLEAKLKDKGLVHVEGLAKACVEVVFEWASEGVTLSDSKVDDFALALLPPLKTFLLSKLDGISVEAPEAPPAA